MWIIDIKAINCKKNKNENGIRPLLGILSARKDNIVQQYLSECCIWNMNNEKHIYRNKA
jgi:hypothetical protein